MTNKEPSWAHPTTENPYWEVVKTIPDGGMSFDSNGWSPSAFGAVWQDGGYVIRDDLPSRETLVREYAWAIPSPDTLEWIVEQLNGRGVVEVGAGTGYWAWQLSQLGVDIVAFDTQPPDVIPNGYHTERERIWKTYTQEDIDEIRGRWKPLYESMDQLAVLDPDAVPFPKMDLPKVGDGTWTEAPKQILRPVYFPVQEGEAAEVAGRHPDRVLFLCWPPYNTSMAVDALLAYEGDRVVFIGEGDGGCTGDDQFFEVLRRDWVEEAFLMSHVQWDAIHDFVFVYRRAEPKAIEA
jgi:hypothetical protein